MLTFAIDLLKSLQFPCVPEEMQTGRRPVMLKPMSLNDQKMSVGRV